MFFEQRWHILAGMFLGAVVALIRFGSYGFVFEKIFLANSAAPHKAFSVIGTLSVFVINQMVLLPLLLAAYMFSPYFFAGVLVGLMLLPLMLFINCLTEALKITHNNFE